MAAALLAAPLVAHAGPAESRDALARAGELLRLRVESGRVAREELSPLLLVDARARDATSEGWFATEAAAALQQAMGGVVRVCVACAAPRVWVEDGRMVYEAGPLSLPELARLDAQLRGDAPAARAAAWVEEHAGGVSLRIVDIGTGRVVFAQNVDPGLTEMQASERVYTRAAELERRARGDSLTQAFVDLAVLPGQHISLDWTDQWGETNANLSGVTLSLVDPIVGIGAVHYRRTPLWNTLVGAKLVVSVPTALTRSVLGESIDELDPLLTAVGVVRVPFGRSNYGGLLTVSTQGTVGLGVSLLNVSVLPVIP